MYHVIDGIDVRLLWQKTSVISSLMSAETVLTEVVVWGVLYNESCFHEPFYTL